MARTLPLALVAILLPGAAWAATSDAALCESAKLGAASKFSACRIKADSVYAKSAQTATDEAKRDAAYAKCDAALAKAYALAEGKYGSACPAEWTVEAVAGRLTACSVLPTPTPEPTPVLTPTPSPCSVVSNGNYTDNCDGTVTDSTTGLVWEKKTGVVGSDVYCRPPGWCLDPHSPNCDPTSPPSCPDPHDVNGRYTWTAGFEPPWPFDGTAKTEFLDRLNCQGAYTSGCTPWLGHNDWRLPTIIELSGRDTYGYATGGIVDLTVPGCGEAGRYTAPCINPIFGPTRSTSSLKDDDFYDQFYWSSSTGPYSPSDAWSVFFRSGDVGGRAQKTLKLFVRAVRSGS